MQATMAEGPASIKSDEDSCILEKRGRPSISIQTKDEPTYNPPHDNERLRRQETKMLFHRATQHIKPGPFYRWIVYLYGERKLWVFFLLHTVATLVIWTHFAMIKFDEQKNGVPDGAPFYWWKRLVPPVEFGSMHAILFQMSLIPLTMCRYSIAALSGSSLGLDRFVPLNRMLRIHIHLGYVMVSIVFGATVLFFTFFGLLCSNGDQAFCDKFTSEIMCTGYAILGCLLIVGGTSYFRNSIPYEVFYIVHHLVFALYLITIAHTIDNVQRNNERNRSQTFQWFSTTILYYVCDRVAMHLNHKYKTRISTFSAIRAGANGSNVGSARKAFQVVGQPSSSRMLILKLPRPQLLHFQPGQYVFLKVPSVDQHWHPFSIASAPSAEELEFYVEVIGPADKTWTGKLWETLVASGRFETAVDQPVKQKTDIPIEIMGPYGTCLAGNMNNKHPWSHGLFIGAGTGIVPVLSMLQQHVRQVIRLSPKMHLQNLHQMRHHRLSYELAAEEKKGSMASKAVRSCWKKNQAPPHSEGSKETSFHDENLSPLTKDDKLRHSIQQNLVQQDDDDSSTSAVDGQRDNGRADRSRKRSAWQLKEAASRATQSLYGVIAMGCLTTFGVALLSLTISWNTLKVDISDGMVTILKTFTVLFQVAFAFVALFVWDTKTSMFLALLDLSACLVAVPSDFYWFGVYDDHGTLRAPEILTICLLTGFQIARLWERSVGPRHVTWQQAAEDSRSTSMECLKVVWVCRSAPLISEILPDLDEMWQGILREWKLEDALKVVQITVYCTDKDDGAWMRLEEELSKSSLLYQHGFVRFGRPNFGEIIQSHSVDLVSQNIRSSNTLVAFCGSPMLAKKIHSLKVSNDMVMAMTGHKKHQSTFVSESYGGVRQKNSPVRRSNSYWASRSVNETLVLGGERGGDEVDEGSSPVATSFLTDHEDDYPTPKEGGESTV
mmetsp:Transcript_2572/g.5364  ORF Transcript_2572/g.5364 Transcript_2572/m.5364 type:complete len:947 (-) Transcript_2572:219-3059(-)